MNDFLNVMMSSLMTRDSTTSFGAEPEIESIGIARVRDNGTIALVLDAAANDLEEDAFLVYVPDDAEYLNVRAHLAAVHGGLYPGAEVSLPRWYAH